MWVCLLRRHAPQALALRGYGWVGAGTHGRWGGGVHGSHHPTPPPVTSVAAFLWRRWGTGEGGLHSAADRAPPPGDTLFCAS